MPMIENDGISNFEDIHSQFSSELQNIPALILASKLGELEFLIFPDVAIFPDQIDGVLSFTIRDGQVSVVEGSSSII
jgi:hypothetical protein